MFMLSTNHVNKLLPHAFRVKLNGDNLMFIVKSYNLLFN